MFVTSTACLAGPRAQRGTLCCCTSPVYSKVRGAVAQWLVHSPGDPVKAAVGLIPGQDRVKVHFSDLLSQRLLRLINACLTFTYTACTTIIVHVKDDNDDDNS